MPRCLWILSPIASTSRCAAAGRPSSRTSCRGAEMPLPYLMETPSQTAGPYVHIGLIPHQAGFDIFEKNFSHVLVGPDTVGERIRIEGRIFDGLGALARDVLVEIWQANADGRYNHPADRQDDKAID